jgi:methyl-accepting chemotaxis protein
MMAWFLTLKIRTKLLVAVGGVMLAVAGLGAFAVQRLSVLNTQSTLIATEWLPGVERIAAIESRLLSFQILAYQHVEAGSSAERVAIESEMQTKRQQLDSLEGAYEETIYLETDRALFNTFREQARRFLSEWSPVQQLSRARRTAEASSLMSRTMGKEWSAVSETLTKLIMLNHKESMAASAKADRVFSQSWLAIVIAVLTLIACGLGAAVYLGRLMEGPLQLVLERAASLSNVCLAGMREGLAALARGDTSHEVVAKTQPINSPSQDEVGMVAHTVDRLIGQAQSAINDYTVVRQRLDGLLRESRTLLTHAQAGNFAARANTTGFEGSYGQLVGGMNELFGAVETPLSEAQQVLAQVANRDLTVRVKGDYRGAFAELKADINGAVGNLSDTLAQVQAAAEQVAAAGQQITSASQSLATGASEQAAGLEEVSSSSTVFASMAKSTAANTKEAQRARASADDGTQQMARLTEAVQEMRRGSADTARIVKTIEEIAFQTNLLALNAAVEAARAGDAGRGFAVVADEVRSLAIRSAEASKSTAALIEQSLQSVERGVAINATATASFSQISTQVSRVSDVVAEISAALDQQSLGVTQINVAIDELNGTTQQAAANAEESASTAEELSSQAEMLRSLVGQFVLDSAAPPLAQSQRPQPQRVTAHGGPRHRNGPSAAKALIPFEGDDEEVLAVF